MKKILIVGIPVILILLIVGITLAGYRSLATSNDPVLVGAGDVATCTGDGDEATARLLDSIPGTVFVAGDEAYEAGSAAQFRDCYGPTWGRHIQRSRPAVGNHEYLTAGAAGYYEYFGAAAGDPDKGYYSYNLGAWHIVVINSNCGKVGGCGAGSKQEQWLRADLAAHPMPCTLAYWHHPRFSSGKHGSFSAMQPIWQALYEHGADVVLAGHDHNYERFAPQDAVGTADSARGIREFVVGTGGKNHYPIGEPIANSEVRNDDTFGVLKLTLHPISYDWQFIPEAGKLFSDSGSSTCHNANSWMKFAAPLIGSLYGAQSGLPIAPTSMPVQRPTPRPTVTPALPLTEGFESGNLSAWQEVSQLVVQEDEFATGEYAARATSADTPVYAIRALGAKYDDLSVRLKFKVLSQKSNVTLMKFRTGKNDALLGVYLGNNGKLGYRNEVLHKSMLGTSDIRVGVWHDLQVHIHIAGASSQVELWLDGTRIDEVSHVEELSDQPIERFQLGENVAGHNYDIAFDDLAIDGHLIGR